MSIPDNYAERVYAGVLGKIIGVYLGRPFEGWKHDRIMAQLGEINYYVHDKLAKPLVVTDDDIAGTFTFLRALPDYGNRRDLTPAQIGQTWLNYMIEERTVLWWGGLGRSTEHTAYLRLKNGLQAPASGSMATNSQVVAEQIGAQIFVDGWAMVAPGDAELAADLARRAASVSHDGEAIYGAQVIAAMEAQAFVEPTIGKLLDTAVSFIPKNSIIYRMIQDIREWRAQEPDWRTTRGWIEARYGYDRFGGACHVVPNHALVILGLLYGDDDFQKTLTIVNTSGWDTDCNSGNAGCIMGIKNGLAGIDAGPDWRGPVADLLYLSMADGGRAVTDAVTEAYHIVNAGRALAELEPDAPKGGARYHFELPGAVQAFQVEDSAECRGTARVENVFGHSRKGKRSLAIQYQHVTTGRRARVATPTFIPPQSINMLYSNCPFVASPSLYAGQTVQAAVSADAKNQDSARCGLYIRVYGANDDLIVVRGPQTELVPDGYHEFAWTIGSTGGQPIAEVGIEIASTRRTDGTIYLDYLAVQGAPHVMLGKPTETCTMWQRAWVDGVDGLLPSPDEDYRLIQNAGTGLIIQGCREWRDYRVGVPVKPHMVKSCGIGACVQGMRRYYALLLTQGGRVRLVKVLDGEKVLAEKDLAWELDHRYEMSLTVVGKHLEASVDGLVLFQVVDDDRPLTAGGVALVCEEGYMDCGAVRVEPA